MWRPSDERLFTMPNGGTTITARQSPPPNELLATKLAVGPTLTPALGTGVLTRVTGDFDGDGKLDFALFNQSTGIWFVVPSGSPTSPSTTQWGLPGDIPVPGFYEGGTTSDMAVFRPSDGAWYIKPSNGSAQYRVPWGLTTDIPVVGDYDGDGISDFVVWRPSNGNWYGILSSIGPSQPAIRNWGLPGDIPAAADFDGNGVSDLAVWRPSNGIWFAMLNSDPTVTRQQQWGLPGDLPTAGDFDNDGTADFAVFRPSTGTEYFILSTQIANPGYQMPLGQAGSSAIYNKPPVTPFIGPR